MRSKGKGKATQKVIYMDVGSWQCREGDGTGSKKKGLFKRSQPSKDPPKPYMTFGLIEHNAVALCNYFPMEEYLKTPKMTGILASRQYNFDNTLIKKFLTQMMRDKYFGDDPNMDLKSAEIKFGDHGHSYHVRKLISFLPNELLDNPKKLIILIPDLHLHYFKDTYLDNFITFYKSSWVNGRPVSKKIIVNGKPKRTSMEKDFATFFESILAFSQKSGVNVEVRVLGDIYEMWESLAAFHFFRPDPDELKKRMKPVISLEHSVKCLKIPAFVGKLWNKFWYELLDQVKELDPSTWDPVTLKGVPNNQKAEIHKTAIAISNADLAKILPQENSPIPLNDLARNLADAIALQYKTSGGTFKDLFQSIPIEVYRSNHDDFLTLKDVQPLVQYVCPLSKMAAAPIEIDKRLSGKSANFMICHGHELDPFNCDEGCSFGFMITSILVLLEASARGDLFKHYEYLLTEGHGLGGHNISPSEAEKRATMAKRKKQIRRIARILQLRDGQLNLSSKHLIFVQAHTHVPYLRGITRSCWKVRYKVHYRLHKPKGHRGHSLPRKSFMKLPYDELGFYEDGN
jgi:hypothetical protein